MAEKSKNFSRQALVRVLLFMMIAFLAVTGGVYWLIGVITRHLMAQSGPQAAVNTVASWIAMARQVFWPFFVPAVALFFIVLGLLLMAAATWPMGLVQTTWELVALRVLQGVASGGIAAPVFALAGDLSKKGGEGRQISLVTMGFALGLATGTLAGGIAGTWSIFWPFVGAAVACVVGAAMVQFVVTDTVRGAEPEAGDDAPAAAHRHAG